MLHFDVPVIKGREKRLWLWGGCSHNWFLGGIQSEFLDIYNATSNSWASYPAGLGQARSSLAAASLPSGLVFFAGGFTGATQRMYGMSAIVYNVVFMSRTCHYTFFLLGAKYSTFVDMYNATSNSWSRHPTGLGQARGALAAASLPSGLVFFAGGLVSGAANITYHLLAIHFLFSPAPYLLGYQRLLILMCCAL
jgi:hypothetical protein